MINKINPILIEVIKHALNNLECLYDFDLSDSEFKESYKFTKEQIRSVLK